MWEYDFYHGQSPSSAGAGISAAAFFIVTMAQLYLLIKFKTKYFIPMVVGGCFEFVGFIFRVLSTRNRTSMLRFSVQQALILLAPLLFAASMYWTLPKLLKYLRSEHVCPIRLKWFSRLFLTGDIVAFLLQLAGSGMQAVDSVRNSGRILAIVGLVVQLIFFGSFTGVVIWCDVSLYKLQKSFISEGRYQWRTLMWALYFTCVLVLLRSCFRFAEFVDGFTGELQTKEIYFYMLDMVPMFFLLVVFTVIHPGMVIKEQKNSDEESVVQLMASRVSTKTRDSL